MSYMLVSISIFLVSGLLALLFNRWEKFSNFLGASGCLAGAAFGLVSLFFVYTDANSAVLSISWLVPFASCSLKIDALAMVFLLPLFVLVAVAALYGKGYLRHYYQKKNIGSTWFLFNLLAASMVLVIISRNAILFLTAWEIMSVSSFFLVLFDDEKKAASGAGLVYIISMHVGTLFLFVMFVLIGNSCGSFDFSAWKMPAAGILPSTIFLCGIIGFGTKAGFMPMHVWLPEAHPAAPSHVSALMSGVMIKTGIYGLLRLISFFKTPNSWWGYLLIVIGCVSGILGVLLALSQHDLKRLLAYSSIENIGIIAIGMGLGVLGASTQNILLTVLGFSACLLHVVNHAFFKGLLFLGAGAVFQATKTHTMDFLGGLFKKMPVTGFCFLIGSAAICGLPPLNGFVSEFLLYFASFKSICGSYNSVIAACAVIGVLALIGGLAVACFTKAFGVIFLGEPRSNEKLTTSETGETEMLMRIPLIVLVIVCCASGFATPFILPLFGAALVDITGLPPNMFVSEISVVTTPLTMLVAVSLVLLTLVFFLVLLRRFLLKGRTISRGPTWDCGYKKPQPSMQYTSSSFAAPIVDFFKGVLGTTKSESRLSAYFPKRFSYETKTVDMFQRSLFRPLSAAIQRMVEKLTFFQHGRIQFYILYILLTLIALLVWKL